MHPKGECMETMRQGLFLLAAQIIVAAAMSGTYANAWVRRRGTRAQRATWFRAGRAMLRLTPAAVALFLGSAVWALIEELPLPHFGLVFWVGATIPLTAGQRWMLRAAGLQSMAKTVPCRRLARLGGNAIVAGTLAGVAALFTVPVVEIGVWFRPIVAGLLIVIGSCGLLGGLSGKPRPVGGIGSLLWLGTWALVVHETLR
jgi:phage shock protein PspC (stress-responsive transcriptional regulator)